MDQNFGKKVVTGISWQFAERILASAVTFVVSVILSQILDPSDYGVIAILMVFIAIADVFVTASETETQGLTVIEAMAASIVPVVIDDDSFRNVVIDDLNGRLFKNKKDYKNIIFSLYDDRKMLNRLSRQARISSSQYSSKYYAERVLDVYNEAIKNYKTNLGLISILKKVGKRNGKEDSSKSENVSTDR